MIIKGIQDEDFENYKKPSMFISFPSCTWKCDKECGEKVCQNGTLATTPNIETDIKTLVDRYINNPITKAVVCGALEPFDTWDDLQKFIIELRQKSQDDIVIYTGYKKEEISYAVDWLNLFPNIIVKFGRFVPDQQKHYDEVLGIYLASDNQHAERIN